MDTALLRSRKEQIVERFGEWTDHNIHIAGDLYTIGENVTSERLRRIVQIIGDLSHEPFERLRVLDLACLEGQYAIEAARQGAEAVGIEVRAANIEKARFVQAALGLDRLQLVQDDVRNLGRERYGDFDVVLCLGILYHLDAPDVFRFVEQIADVCTGFAVFDTFLSIVPERSRTYKGGEYWGREMPEHNPDADTEERLKDKWASVDNDRSFWITRESLYNLLLASGFTSVYECHVPPEKKYADRVTLVAVKGRKYELFGTPAMNSAGIPHIAESPKIRVSPEQRTSHLFAKALTHTVPAPLRKAAKQALRKAGFARPDANEPWRWAKPWERRES